MRVARRAMHAGILAGVLLLPATGRGDDVRDASPLTPDESARMMRGETIERTQAVDRAGRHYVGGVTYTAVDASAEELQRIFEDVPSYQAILPHTTQARLVARTSDALFVEVHQGNALVQAQYTIHLLKDAPHDGRREVLFWLDRGVRHDIEDAWGFFRVEPLAPTAGGAPRVLLSYGILLDIGPGLLRTLFETRIRDAMLSVPQRLRAYLARGRGAKSAAAVASAR